jgi:hypothetical protein
MFLHIILSGPKVLNLYHKKPHFEATDPTMLKFASLKSVYFPLTYVYKA